MTTKTIKTIAFIVLLVHGIGHLQGVITSLGIKISHTASPISWLLKGLGENTNRAICLVLYLLTAAIGILAALSFKGIFFPVSSWQWLALLTAFMSSFCLILFPNALAMFFNKIGAIAVNLIIFYSLLFNAHWPSALFED